MPKQKKPFTGSRQFPGSRRPPVPEDVPEDSPTGRRGRVRRGRFADRADMPAKPIKARTHRQVAKGGRFGDRNGDRSGPRRGHGRDDRQAGNPRDRRLASPLFRSAHAVGAPRRAGPDPGRQPSRAPGSPSLRAGTGTEEPGAAGILDRPRPARQAQPGTALPAAPRATAPPPSAAWSSSRAATS